MTSLLLDTENKREQREYAEAIRDSSEALLGVLNNIVDFSAIEAGRVHLEMSEFQPGRIIREAVAPYAEAATNKGIALVVDIDTGLPERVTGDAGRLLQILVNLIGNAVKFTDRGKVIVRAEPWPTRSPAIGIRFHVEDTGIGFSDNEKARIFAVYSQLDSSTTRRHGGAGLGLAIARRLVEMMGGVLEVESEPGHGSRFWFTALFRQAATAVASTQKEMRTQHT
jgi:two-component system sensor histidine kinase/response regulator